MIVHIDLSTGLIVSDAAAAGLPNVEQRTVTPAEFETLLAAHSDALVTVAQIRQIAHVAIDAQAGATRRKYITDATGQDATYMSKAVDAAAFSAAGYPLSSIANYPWVQAEAEAIAGAPDNAVLSAMQYQSAADAILATQRAWGNRPMGSTIEKYRRGGKIAVSNAQTVADVQMAQAAAIAALAAL